MKKAVADSAAMSIDGIGNTCWRASKISDGNLQPPKNVEQVWTSSLISLQTPAVRNPDAGHDRVDRVILAERIRCTAL